MSIVLVIGGGASGMMSAIVAARRGHKVTIFEKNEKLGKKLYITGKGRCNLTNTCDRDAFFDNVVTNPKFFMSAFSRFNNYDALDFFEGIGLSVKIERGNRAFPTSDKSSDVIDALRRELIKLNVEINYNCQVEKLVFHDNVFYGLKIKNRPEVYKGNSVIIATGGLSYPLTGSTGDGYTFASEIGHSITELSPSLVPIHLAESYVKDLMGLSLKNVGVTAYVNNKQIYNDFGELIFTHFGISGPIVLSLSSFLIPYLKQNKDIALDIDLKPALTSEQLDARILRDFEQQLNKQYKNSLNHLLPNKLIDVIIRLSNIDPEKKVNNITKEERFRLLNTLKHLTFHITKLSDYSQAVITKGGVNVKEINPSTMESKLIKNVYFVGEVLDLDALTGGYNLQIAWSTAYIAGNSIM